MDERDDLGPAQLSSQGASTHLDPRPHSGGEQEPQGPVPPYEGRQTEAKEGLDEHMDKVFHRVDEVPPGPGREISDEERRLSTRAGRPTPATPPGPGAGPRPAGWTDRGDRRDHGRSAGRWQASPA
jgi:hypothetical protein